MSDTSGMTSVVLDAPPAHAHTVPPALDRTSAEALAARAFELEPVPRFERAGVLRGEAALLLDRLLTRVARCHGALDVAVGEGLAALAVGARTLRLGFAGIGDYARERLGIAGRTAQDLARLARELKERPLLAAAVRSGEVSARKAQTVLVAARGEAEAEWVERARRGPCALWAPPCKRRPGARGRPRPARPSRTTSHGIACDLALAGATVAPRRGPGPVARVLGATAPEWQCLEAICAEYLGAHGGDEPDEDADGGGGPLCTAASVPWLEAAKEALEEETRRWAFLDELSPVDPVAAPTPVDATDALRLDAELRELAALRDRWDEVLGHLAMLLQSLGLWRDMQFASLAHYCTERLGSRPAPWSSAQWLARRCSSYRARGRRSGRTVSTRRPGPSQAGTTRHRRRVDCERQTNRTCVALRREAERRRDRQMCAPGSSDLRLPRPGGHVLAAALRAARGRRAAGWTPGECLEHIATHFIETWQGRFPRPRTAEARAIERDGGYARCRVAAGRPSTPTT